VLAGLSMQGRAGSAAPLGEDDSKDIGPGSASGGREMNREPADPRERVARRRATRRLGGTLADAEVRLEGRHILLPSRSRPGWVSHPIPCTRDPAPRFEVRIQRPYHCNPDSLPMQ
jgi:hypothetical protein